MSALLVEKLITPCGSITNATLGGYVDAAGNVVGSPGFLPNYVIDYAGNLGTIPVVSNNCTFIATIIGSALEPGPWEMAVGGTTETIGAHLGTIAQNYVAGTTPATALTNFASANTIGYMGGNITGTGTFTIQNGPQSIGGTTYAGNGLTIFTGVNTATGILNMEPGTKIQFGEDCSNATTKWTGNLTIQTGATATQYTSFPNATFLCQALTNTGTYNVIGCGTCGVGGINYASTVANNGTINIDDAAWRNQSTWSGTGTVNVKDGGTFQLAGNAIGATTRININGCGWCNTAGKTVGALNMTNANFTYQARIHVQTASCIRSNSGAGTTFNGLLTGGAPLDVGTLGTPVNGIVVFGNQSNTYYGTLTSNGTLIGMSLNALKYATLTATNGGQFTANSAVFKSIYGSDATSYLTGSGNTYIENNGVTQFDGRFLWNGQGVTHNIYLQGPGNQLTLTAKGSSATVYVQNGAKLILQGATFSNPTAAQMRLSGGATISAGTSTDAACSVLWIDATSKFEVRAVGAGTGLLTVNGGVNFTAGWKVDLPDAMAPGVYTIMKHYSNTTTLPTTGVNNTGRTVSYAWNNAVNPRELVMTLA